jgi:hypothetical protein
MRNGSCPPKGEDLTPDVVERALLEPASLVRDRLPERFYR